MYANLVALTGRNVGRVPSLDMMDIHRQQLQGKIEHQPSDLRYSDWKVSSRSWTRLEASSIVVKQLLTDYFCAKVRNAKKRLCID